MDRSRFISGVPVTGSDFQFESEARQNDNQRVLINGMQTGVLSGFGVTVVGGSPTTVQAAPGSGYVGDVDFGNKLVAPTGLNSPVFGSYIKNSISNNLVPGTWLAGVIYYVCAVYKEEDTIERPDEDGTTLQPVRTEEVSVDCDLEIIKQSDYLALADEDKHLRLKLAEIVPSALDTVVAGDITLPWTISRVKTAGSLLLTGVEVLFVSTTAVDGVSQIEWDATGTQLRWQDAGDGSPGAWESVVTDGIHFLYSSTVSKYIKVRTASLLFPVSSGVFDLTITDLYEGLVRPSSGADRLLRSYGGTALKTRINPLGLSVSDLGPGVGEDIKSHRVYMHANGIVGSIGMLGCTIVDASPEDFINVTVPAGSDRFFVKGNIYDSIQDSEYPMSPGASYTLQFGTLGTLNWSLCEVYIDEFGVLKYNVRAEIADASRNIDGVILLDLRLDPESTGTFQLDYDYEVNARTLQFNNGKIVTLIPGIDYVYELIGENEYDKLVVYVDWSELLLLDGSDTWTWVGAPIEGVHDGLVICNVVHYNTNLYGNGADFVTGGGVPLDRRIFGTLGEDNLRDDTKEYVEYVGREIINNGVIQGFTLSESPANTLKIEPGRGFVKGREVIVGTETSINFAVGYTDGNWYVWLSQDGTIEAVAEPLDGASNVINDIIWNFMRERAILAKVAVLTNAIDSWEDRRNYAGIGEINRGDQSEPISVGFPALAIRESPEFSSGRLIKIGDDFYSVINLLYDYINGLWSLEDSTNSGLAFKLQPWTGTGVPGTNPISGVYYLKGGSSSTATLLNLWETHRIAESSNYYLAMKAGNTTDALLGLATYNSSGNLGYLRAAALALVSDEKMEWVANNVDNRLIYGIASPGSFTIDTGVTWNNNSLYQYIVFISFTVTSATSSGGISLKFTSLSGVGDITNWNSTNPLPHVLINVDYTLSITNANARTSFSIYRVRSF